jgi:hypothetical protein
MPCSSVVQSGPFPQNERQPALLQGFRGWVIPEYVVDKKLLRKVQRKTCEVCTEAKLQKPSHKGHLPVPDSPWRRLAMDLSVRFYSVSYQDNCYQMAIIDTKNKYVWDYY